MRAEDFEILRRHMLAEISAGILQLRDAIGKTALDERVMKALDKVPRHEFVPIELQPYAYANIPLPIGFDKTISQPFIVGWTLSEVKRTLRLCCGRADATPLTRLGHRRRRGLLDYPPVEEQTCPPIGGRLRVRQTDTAQGGRHVNRARLQPCSRQLAS